MWFGPAFFGGFLTGFLTQRPPLPVSQQGSDTAPTSDRRHDFRMNPEFVDPSQHASHQKSCLSAPKRRAPIDSNKQ